MAKLVAQESSFLHATPRNSKFGLECKGKNPETPPVCLPPRGFGSGVLESLRGGGRRSREAKSVHRCLPARGQLFSLYEYLIVHRL